MSKFHNDIEREELALAWHKLGTFLSLVTTIGCLGCAVVAGAGIAWHHWATKQHEKAIDDLYDNSEKN